MNIKENILSYNSDGKMAHIYKEFNMNDIINAVLDILENSSTENTLNIEMFNSAIMFITDTIIFSDLSDMDKNIFLKSLSELNYFEKIEMYLYNEYLNIKCIVIHSIGKISIRDNVRYLEKAFEKYFNTNPIICSDLLFEIKWLDDKRYNYYYSLIEKDDNLINSMALSIFLEDCPYGIIVKNIQSNLKQKDWTKEEYIKAIKYYKSNKENKCIDYERMYNEIQKY